MTHRITADGSFCKEDDRRQPRLVVEPATPVHGEFLFKIFLTSGDTVTVILGPAEAAALAQFLRPGAEAAPTSGAPDLVREPPASESWAAEDRRALALRLAVQLHERGSERGNPLGAALIAAERFESYLRDGDTP